ncbi:MAG: type II toxin-antitoxin system mRNA interferase toxin, RelE/StbE family [Microcoleus sp. PH2017_10_PVI_O_A]|uniref:type II toxin-antitoxin system RelE/ParE family toxin n=1 Tax=unclassified Microcoleus TaxID=2642155 RepID=UPI001E197B37|nr:MULTISPECIES: type II toxin-antitoxin system mRNA interferase toxin, RelE/StbE family [unclassified Microcoleus]TAE77593.1 MAG: type II toxin-antitoxin system mRNA interferase toxin, RelE/StbE family [Oscillatoriales cyanobacterium]MCC3408791.1 type II toxin-antitoxin system mRNA interferase toxin, RelE/StbE family [Microcoleus sp. PH2017_10_PVI_O_A]MCC3462904.1 type II toxin-antitoxin system mRNA interferase toxin, RelE/StbE family [Microcoleus sp. PH2017_11_PCY_U_A]MCC3481623.1 type II tox
MILTTAPSFKRSLKRLIKKNQQLQDQILEVLELLGDDPFNPVLKSHKLTGKLDGLWSCSVAYDCRIIFAFKKDSTTGDDLIVLVDIGSHDEVY